MPFISRERVEQLEAERKKIEQELQKAQEQVAQLKRQAETADVGLDTLDYLDRLTRLVPALEPYIIRYGLTRTVTSPGVVPRLNTEKIWREIEDIETFEAYKRGKERSERLKPSWRVERVLGFDPAASEGILDGLVRTFNTGDLLAPSLRPASTWDSYVDLFKLRHGTTPKKDQRHPNPNGCGGPCTLCDNPQPASETAKHPVRTITVDVVADMKKLTEALADAVARQSETKDTEGAKQKGQDVKGNPKKKRATK